MTYLTRFGRARHVYRTRVLRLTVRAVVGGVEGCSGTSRRYWQRHNVSVNQRLSCCLLLLLLLHFAIDGIFIAADLFDSQKEHFMHTHKHTHSHIVHRIPHPPHTHTHPGTHTHIHSTLGVKHSQAQQMLRFECLPCIRNENRIKYKINCCYVLLCVVAPPLSPPFPPSLPTICWLVFEVGLMWTMCAAFCCISGMVCLLLVCKSCDSIRLYLIFISGIGSI